MRIKLSLFPGGCRRALTMSYDDGREFDRRLVEIFNRYGLKGTFHLNSDLLGTPGYVTRKEVPSLYGGHEIASHTASHVFLTQCPVPEQIDQIKRDKETLEELCGYPVGGMSWPYGDFDAQSIASAQSCGVEYSRTTQDSGKFSAPQDFMRWNPTTHHSGDLEGLWERFLDDHREERKLFHIWGHSYEFEYRDGWNKIEEFCKKAGDTKGIWHATGIEVKRYLDALKSLVFSSNLKIIQNPSALEVWVSADGTPVRIRPGETVRL